jgi:chemotaxis protein CheD
MPAFSDGLSEVFVEPGEARLVENPSVLRTVLGSCVGVVFWVPGRGVGALCHPMLPRVPVRSLGREPAEGINLCKYVDYTIREMARRVDRFGVPRSGVQIKLFGGGDVLVVHDERVRPTVGQMNCQVAVDTLEEEGFIVKASSLGGTRGVNIYFHTGTGEVLLRRLQGSNPRTVC